MNCLLSHPPSNGRWVFEEVGELEEVIVQIIEGHLLEESGVIP
jgi:hypothetical protein